MRLEDLRDADLDDLNALYEDADVPDEPPQGEMRGAVLAGRGPASTSVWKTAARYAPWSGMRLGDTPAPEQDGVNRLGYGPLTFERYGFESYVERDRDGGALVLDYDVRENPYALRRLKERVREFGDLYLGKAYLSVGGRDIFLHYYAMEPVEREIPIRS
ncbi:MAG: hypothetical protein ACOCRA_05295 [Halobacteria archaeon]